MRISKFAIFLIVIVAVWGYFGFPSPDTLLSLADAQQQCTDFAKRNQEKLFFDEKGDEIRAFGQWIKNGKVVVEVGAIKPGDTMYTPRLCVIGGGQIEIVSILENSAWR